MNTKKTSKKANISDGFALGLLAAHIYEPNATQSRVDFLSIIFSGGKKTIKALKDGVFYENGYGVTQRDYDTCFESGDGDEVCSQLLERSKIEGFELPQYLLDYCKKNLQQCSA